MKYKTDKRMIQRIKSKIFLSGPNRKGQTIQKDGAQSYRPKLAVGLWSSVKRLETGSQELIWWLDCRSGVMRRVEVWNFQCGKQISKSFIVQFYMMVLYIALLPPPVTNGMRLLENGLQKQGGKPCVTTFLISQGRERLAFILMLLLRHSLNLSPIQRTKLYFLLYLLRMVQERVTRSQSIGN